MLPIQKETAMGKPRTSVSQQQAARGASPCKPWAAGTSVTPSKHQLLPPVTTPHSEHGTPSLHCHLTMSLQQLCHPLPGLSTKETIHPVSHRRGTKIKAHHRGGKLFKLESFAPGHPPLNSRYTLLYHSKFLPATPSLCKELSCPRM